jgi:predicted nucleic acid-binding protein
VIVIDASAFVDISIREDAQSEWILGRLESEPLVQVPALFDVEVLHSLRRLDAVGAVGEKVIAAALAYLDELRADRHDHALLRPRIWALRHNLSAYDAAYVALAEALDVSLVTTDARLARSSGHQAVIESPPA